MISLAAILYVQNFQHKYWFELFVLLASFYVY